ASSGCSINETPPPNVLEKDGSKANIAFGWKVVLIGYGCRVVLGMAMGCVVFQTGKAKSNLEHLDLSSVSVSTEFIDSVDNLQALKYLDLSRNSFIQGLSVSITNLSSLEYLIIRGAFFFGGLRYSIGNPVSSKLSLVVEPIEWTNSKIIGEPLATHLFRLGREQIEWTNSIVNSKPNAAGILGNI
ncbi:hypothetical protein Gotur_028205, partial [Gossypium turneri]